jgi:DNA-binding response OmpR family regulator
MRILIVDDEARLAGSVARGLREEGFAVETSGDGEDALHRLRTEPFDLAILDVMLPKRNGWAVLDTLRAERRALRVLMLTARQSVEDRVRGLESGADDYLVKPFAFADLLARVRAPASRSRFRRKSLPCSPSRHCPGSARAAAPRHCDARLGDWPLGESRRKQRFCTTSFKRATRGEALQLIQRS